MDKLIENIRSKFPVVKIVTPSAIEAKIVASSATAINIDSKVCYYCDKPGCTPWKHKCKNCRGNGHEAATCNRAKRFSRGARRHMRRKTVKAYRHRYTMHNPVCSWCGGNPLIIPET
jgi:hypothetical protein